MTNEIANICNRARAAQKEGKQGEEEGRKKKRVGCGNWLSEGEREMDDYTREMMDLKTLVTRTLEKKGVLARIRVRRYMNTFTFLRLGFLLSNSPPSRSIQFFRNGT